MMRSLAPDAMQPVVASGRPASPRSKFKSKPEPEPEPMLTEERSETDSPPAWLAPSSSSPPLELAPSPFSEAAAAAAAHARRKNQNDAARGTEGRGRDLGVRHAVPSASHPTL